MLYEELKRWIFLYCWDYPLFWSLDDFVYKNNSSWEYDVMILYILNSWFDSLYFSTTIKLIDFVMWNVTFCVYPEREIYIHIYLNVYSFVSLA